MAVPSVSCTYSWPVWTEEHWLGLTLQFAVCSWHTSLSQASTAALMAILEAPLPAH